MATRSKYLFVTPTEFVTWLPATISALRAYIIVDRGLSAPFMHWDGKPDTLLQAEMLYVTSEKKNISNVMHQNLAPAEHGWIDVDVPQIKAQYLCKVSTGVKSRWFASVEEGEKENPDALKLFDRFWRKWKPHFTFGLIVRNVKLSSEGFDRGVGYSPGVDGWVRNGGHLCNNFGENIEFFPPESTNKQ